MAECQIMYWKNVPVQVKAWDEGGEVGLEMPIRFQQAIDDVATRQGLINSDAYMEWFHWGEPMQVLGNPEEAAEQMIACLESEYPQTLNQLVEFLMERVQ